MASQDIRPELLDLSSRLRLAIEKLGVGKREFAEAGDITPQTLSGYLASLREPSFSVLAGWLRTFHLNINWLLTGEGPLFLDQSRPASIGLPEEELSEKLTPEQRNMLTYKRLQTELGTSNSKIAEGLDTIVSGKSVSERKTGYNLPDKEGLHFDTPNKIHEGQLEFGTKK